MDLRLTPAQESFRSELRVWLEENVPNEPLAHLPSPEGVAQHRAWEKKLHSAGFAAVHWPVEYGGRGLDPISISVFNDEYARANAPWRLSRLGLGLAGPTIMDLGTPEQKDRWLPRILSCDDIWCQGFSEPGAGSDLASLKTRGELLDDGILINGQKVWTSHSLYADWMIALVRTDSSGVKHHGITFLVVDMKDPGVTVRPIRQMNHATEFSEVFFENVFVPYDNVIGEINQGWKVAMHTLTHERGSGLNTAGRFQELLRETVDLIPAERRSDPRIRGRIGKLYQEIEAYRYMTLRTTSAIAKKQEAGGVAYMGKLWWSELQVRIFELGFDALKDLSVLEDGPDESYRQRYWLARAAHIYAGANDVQRNIIAERVLGLPKEKSWT